MAPIDFHRVSLLPNHYPKGLRAGNTSIKSLNLTDNDLGDDGADAIGSGIEGHVSLTALDQTPFAALDENRLHDLIPLLADDVEFAWETMAFGETGTHFTTDAYGEHAATGDDLQPGGARAASAYRFKRAEAQVGSR